jgi:hypothetical protein
LCPYAEVPHELIDEGRAGATDSSFVCMHLLDTGLSVLITQIVDIAVLSYGVPQPVPEFFRERRDA